jgi:ATP synthase protein I
VDKIWISDEIRAYPMNKDTPSTPTSASSDQIKAKAKHKQRTRGFVSSGTWLDLHIMGLMIWSMAVPTLLGAAIGLRLDKRHPGIPLWTWVLLVAGLIFGCVNAWQWVIKEEKSIRDERAEYDK